MLYESFYWESQKSKFYLKTNKIMKNKLIYGYILGLLTSLVVMILVNLLKKHPLLKNEVLLSINQKLLESRPYINKLLNKI